jgi:4-amino-4-deoxy-L-arabinose transferase-like glycosyltransferase
LLSEGCIPKLGLPLDRTRWAILILISGFFLAQLPFLGATYRFHYDEKYYTDAAIRMYRHGDLLVPHYSDDSLRLRKPILTYWVILSGFKLGGVSYAAARTGILLAMIGVLAATAKLTRTLFGRTEAALLAVAFLLSDYEIFTASWRLNPDALLCLWVTLALLGFALHAFSPRGSSGALLLGYAGAGLAMATKGFLGAAAALYGLAFCRWASSHLPGTPRRTKIHLAGLAIALLIGASWYVAMAVRYGPASLTDFLRDQAGLQPGGAGLGIAGHPPRYLLTTFGDFVPAFLILAIAFKVAPKRLRGFWLTNRRQVVFAIGWFALIFLVFALGRVFRPRYLLPGHPLLAALFGAAVVAVLQDANLKKPLRHCRGWGLAIAVTFGVMVGLLGLQFDPRFPLASVVIVAIALLAWKLPQSAMSFVVGISVWIFGALWSYDAFLRPIFGETATSGFVAPLESVPESVPVFTVGTPYRVEAQLAVLSGGRHIPRTARTVAPFGTTDRPVFILPEELLNNLPIHDYRVAAVGYVYRHVDGRLFVESWKGKSRERLLAERRRILVLALPLR